jgi:sec-independent protein translocase protein TatC
MKVGRFSLKQKSVADDYNDPPRPFLEHLMDLRDCVIKCAISWVVCSLSIVPFIPKIMEFLMAPAGTSLDKVQGLGWTVGVEMILRIVFWGGTTLSLPLLAYFILRFIFPGLKRSEKTLILVCLVGSTFLFLGGVWLAYATTLTIAIQVLEKITAWVGLRNDIVRIDEHVSFVLKMLIGFGLAFQLPLLLLAFGWLGFISSQSLRDKRRLAIVIIFIISMVLTPPDPASQIIMAVPMCALYEICIWAIWLREKAIKKKEDPNAQSNQDT